MSNQDDGGQDSDELDAPFLDVESDLPEPLRVLGREGMAVMLTPVPIFTLGPLDTGAQIGFDIALVDPSRLLIFRNRHVRSNELQLLADFFERSMVSDVRTDFRSITGGFDLVMIPTSRSTEVLFKIEVRTPTGGLGDESLRLVFATNRIAFWGPAQGARRHAAGARDSGVPLHLRMNDGESA